MGLSYQNYRTILKERSPEPGFDITIDLQWHGGTNWMIMKSILSQGVKNAVEMYRTELRKLLSRTWGSVGIGGNRRVRKWHSKPYMPPFMQTKNLVNSLKKGFHATGSGWNWELKGEIFTLVPYAQTLEYGGVAAKLNRKPYTQIKLVNPINKPIIIAPRPAWRPTFRKNVVRMFKAITKHGVSVGLGP